MLTREIADRLIEQFENMSEADRDALFERAGVRFLADDIQDLVEEYEQEVCYYNPLSSYRFDFADGLSAKGIFFTGVDAA